MTYLNKWAYISVTFTLRSTNALYANIRMLSSDKLHFLWGSVLRLIDETVVYIF